MIRTYAISTNQIVLTPKFFALLRTPCSLGKELTSLTSCLPALGWMADRGVEGKYVGSVNNPKSKLDRMYARASTRASYP